MFPDSLKITSEDTFFLELLAQVICFFKVTRTANVPELQHRQINEMSKQGKQHVTAALWNELRVLIKGIHE